MTRVLRDPDADDWERRVGEERHTHDGGPVWKLLVRGNLNRCAVECVSGEGTGRVIDVHWSLWLSLPLVKP